MNNTMCAVIALGALLLTSALCACSSTTPSEPTNKFAIRDKVVATTTENVSGVSITTTGKTATTDATGSYANRS